MLGQRRKSYGRLWKRTGARLTGPGAEGEKGLGWAEMQAERRILLLAIVATARVSFRSRLVRAGAPVVQNHLPIRVRRMHCLQVIVAGAQWTSLPLVISGFASRRRRIGL